MLDEQGSEVLPAEFIAAAERQRPDEEYRSLVIGASLSFAANRKRLASSFAYRRTRYWTRASSGGSKRS